VDNTSAQDMTKELEAIRMIVGQPIATASNPILTVGDLTVLFPSPELPKDDSIRQIVTPAAESATAQTGVPQLGSLVHNFVSAFQRVSDEWQAAFAPAGPEAPATA
jgi:hypothetical protein